MNLLTRLHIRKATPENEYQDCYDCKHKTWSIFCPSCQTRYCANHIDDLEIHKCGISGLTKKALRRFVKERALPLTENELQAIKSGKEMAKLKANAKGGNK